MSKEYLCLKWELLEAYTNLCFAVFSTQIWNTQSCLSRDVLVFVCIRMNEICSTPDPLSRKTTTLKVSQKLRLNEWDMPHFDATKSRSQFRGHEYSIKNLPFITAMAIIHSLRRERRHGWVASLLYKPEHMDNGRPQCTQGVLNLYIDEMKGYTLNLL